MESYEREAIKGCRQAKGEICTQRPGNITQYYNTFSCHLGLGVTSRGLVGKKGGGGWVASYLSTNIMTALCIFRLTSKVHTALYLSHRHPPPHTPKHLLRFLIIILQNRGEK